jgi:hypothetical protein
MQEENNNIVDIESLFENAKKDPTLLFSTIDVHDLLNSIETEIHNYLENKTLDSIACDIFNIINELDISQDKKKTYCDKLLGYRYVDEIRELFKGKHIRWIKKTKPNEITNGGIVVNIKFCDSGTVVVCKNAQNRFIQIRFDDSHIFQKMTTEEQMILMVHKYLDE